MPPNHVLQKLQHCFINPRKTLQFLNLILHHNLSTQSNQVNPSPLTVESLCSNGQYRDAIALLCRQRKIKEAVDALIQYNIPPDVNIYGDLLLACRDARSLEQGRRISEAIQSSGLKLRTTFLQNRLLDMFSKCGGMEDAEKVFEALPERNLCAWNTLIGGYLKNGKLEEASNVFERMTVRDDFCWTTMVSGYVKAGKPAEALEFFRRMQRDGVQCNLFTVASVLSACATVGDAGLGAQVHAWILRKGDEMDVYVWSALLDLYAKCRKMEQACQVFEAMPEKDVVSWNMMIGRLVQSGHGELGLKVFRNMVRSESAPNQYTFASVLSACGMQVALEKGKQAHGYVIRRQMSSGSFVESSLVHMYSKCGDVKSAKQIFERLTGPDLITWTSVIMACAQNGEAKEAIELFERMLRSGLKPDRIAFVSVLSACAHAGLVDEGRRYFESMTKDFGILPIAYHYTIMIDLLGRAGLLEEAEELVAKMQCEGDAFLWSSLLSACRIHKNVELAEKAAEHLFKLEPDNPATFATLSNIYESEKRWDCVALIRAIMEEKGIKRQRGKSWIDVRGKVSTFMVSDRTHPQSGDIYAKLEELEYAVKAEGYMPETNIEPHGVNTQQKERAAASHSERLALAFGLINTAPGVTVRIIKNLRICGDCHNFIKIISKIVEREIVVRDFTRFHHFKDGVCTCGDYW